MANEAFSIQRNPVRSREEVQLPLIEGSYSRGKCIRLKTSWCRLLKQNEMSVHNVPSVIHVCCILHNMLEIRKEMFMESKNKNIIPCIDKSSSIIQYYIIRILLIIVFVHLQTQDMIENSYEEYWFQQIQVEIEMFDASGEEGSHVTQNVGMGEYRR